MSFFLDTEGFYRPPQKTRSLSPSWCFGTRKATLPEGPLATVHQVHSTRVLRANGPGMAGEADALITDVPGLRLAVKTADCIPILLVDFKHRAVAAVHAGWRGTAGRIAAATVESMSREFQTNPKDLHAAIGPGIGKCCFEVGAEVARALAGSRTVAGEATMAGEAPKFWLDLPRINREQLEDAGLLGDHIYDSGLCTMCRPEEFFSYRRDREQAGRMYSIIQA